MRNPTYFDDTGAANTITQNKYTTHSQRNNFHITLVVSILLEYKQDILKKIFNEQKHIT